MKKIAVAFNENSSKILRSLRSSKLIDEIFIASSSELNKNKHSENQIKHIVIKKFLEQYWTDIDLLIFIGSLGASIRLINPFLNLKENDPGVIVMDKNNSKIIPLIGLHQSNTKNIAGEISALFGGEIIDTSNSSNECYLNLDSFGYRWGWNRSGETRDWSTLVMLQARRERIFYEHLSGSSLWQKSLSAQKLNPHTNQESLIDDKSLFHVSIFKSNTTVWHPPTLWIGIGCEKNTNIELLRDSLNELLEDKKISSKAIAGIATVDLKKSEQAIIELSKENKWPIMFFSSKELSQIKVPNPSEVVMAEIGTPSVAEASCILAGGKDGKLIAEKKIFRNVEHSKRQFGAVTLAISHSTRQFAPHKGEIHIIGSGPGNLSYLTGDVRKTLRNCPVWIGYKMYLDLLEPIRTEDQVRIDSELTQEKQRCEKAISLAQEGIKVALISSGDAGIYGMAGLLLEIIKKIEKVRRPHFEIHPGISCFQLASAISGAPIMNDFCAISLSDKLIPWEIIEKRIKGAILGDFVVALFNPKSAERKWQLRKTIDLFLTVRKGETPVLIARQVGRDNESKKFSTLEKLPIEEVDMLSIIIVGNSQTNLEDDIFITPRGYN